MANPDTKVGGTHSRGRRNTDCTFNSLRIRGKRKRDISSVYNIDVYLANTGRVALISIPSGSCVKFLSVSNPKGLVEVSCSGHHDPVVNRLTKSVPNLV